MWYHCQCGFYIDFWVNTSLIHRYQHPEEYNVPIFCKQEDGGCWVSLKMKQNLPILNLNSIITKRTRYRDIPSHTWILFGDNYTLPWRTSGTPTFHNLSVETKNIFKAKLWYYISKSTMTKPSHSVIRCMVNDKILSLFASLQNYIHSLGGFKVTLSSVSVCHDPQDSWSCQDFSMYFS